MKRLSLSGWTMRPLSKLSMRTKMVAAFSVPILVLGLFLVGPVSSMVTDSARHATLSSGNQSFEQACSLLDYFLHTMDYASDQIYYNNDLQSILSSPNFHGGRNRAVQYREYLQLDKVFTSAEGPDVIYQAKIYIPDDINYINDYHFSGQSDLEKLSNYKEIMETLRTSRLYYTDVHTVYVPGKSAPADVISLMRLIRTTNGTAEPLAVAEISILESKIRNVLCNADSTEDGCVFLINLEDTVLAASNASIIDDTTPPHTPADDWETVKVKGEPYYMRSAYLSNGSWILVSLLSERSVSQSGNALRKNILFATFSAILVCFLVACYLAGYYTRSLKMLQSKMRLVQQGQFDVSFSNSFINSEDEIGGLFKSFEYMTHELERLMREQYRIGQAVQSAELRALQAQINPHILYNTLDLINWEALDHNAPLIAELTYSLASFYRISLNKGRHIVTLEEELLHVEAYINLENFHFDGAIHFIRDVPSELLDFACINIILQPFVENSINHGFANHPEKESCRIVIRAERVENSIFLYIEDDGVGMTQEEMEKIFIQNENDKRSTHGYGIKNINSRLHLYYGSEYGLSFGKSANGGMLVCIHIPAMTLSEAESKFAFLTM